MRPPLAIALPLLSPDDARREKKKGFCASSRSPRERPLLLPVAAEAFGLHAVGRCRQSIISFASPSAGKSEEQRDSERGKRASSSATSPIFFAHTLAPEQQLTRARAPQPPPLPKATSSGSFQRLESENFQERERERRRREGGNRTRRRRFLFSAVDVGRSKKEKKKKSGRPSRLRFFE